VFCREHAMQLHRDRDDFEAAGVELAVVGQGTPRHAAHFRGEYGLGFRLLVDPDREAYKAAGAKRATVSELFGPRVMARGFRAAAANRIAQGRTQGDAGQLGGVLVVVPDGAVTYAHMAEDASDVPPNEEILQAARSAAERHV
jgi:hypothetical protein